MIISVINQPGGNSREIEDTRIVGFRVKVSDLDKIEGKYCTDPSHMEVLCLEYLKSRGYAVEKANK
ncbi:TPA: hypothetical protein MA058_003410 [Klebsiella pneumoniae]|nr:hypothetical protein [Klebsiella pneumoniae]